MNIRILGSAAGGGFPQWNCNCHNCRGVRAGTVQTQARTQSSIAIRGKDEHAWTLINASPDILAQLLANRDLQPARASRDTGIRSVLFTDSQIDHTTGLFMLREHKQQWPLWCTDVVFEDLTTANPLLRVLGHYCGIDRHRIPLDSQWFGVDGVPNLRWQAIPLGGKGSPYSPHRNSNQPGNAIALLVEDINSKRSLFYAPGLAKVNPELFAVMSRADCVLVDGTFWNEDELSEAEVGHKRAADMGHLPQSGDDGMISWLDRLPASTRRVLIHINNTNPILIEDSPQRRVLGEHHIEVANDGMEIVL